MTSAELIAELFERIRGNVHDTLDGLPVDDLTARVDPAANTIAWLVWHLARVQDDHVSKVADRKQVWHDGGWIDRFDLPFADDAIGYGQSSLDVAEVRPASLELLTGYYDAVHERTVEFVTGLTDKDLERVVDESWDPPVTLGTRLVSVIADDLQHVGQAAYVRGVLDRTR